MTKKHETELGVIEWAKVVWQTYDDAIGWLEQATDLTMSMREAKYETLVRRTHELGIRYAQSRDHPCHALAQRLLFPEDALLQFVLVDGLSAESNRTNWRQHLCKLLPHLGVLRPQTLDSFLVLYTSVITVKPSLGKCEHLRNPS